MLYCTLTVHCFLYYEKVAQQYNIHSTFAQNTVLQRKNEPYLMGHNLWPITLNCCQLQYLTQAWFVFVSTTPQVRLPPNNTELSLGRQRNLCNHGRLNLLPQSQWERRTITQVKWRLARRLAWNSRIPENILCRSLYILTQSAGLRDGDTEHHGGATLRWKEWCLPGTVYRWPPARSLSKIANASQRSHGSTASMRYTE